MNTTLTGILLTVLSYLLGSVSFAMISSKLFGLKDPRTFGSGNPGATNVLRSGSKKAAIFTLIGDALKGYLAVYVTAYLLMTQPGGTFWVALSAIAVFMGHVWSVFLKFRGGKGVATSLGVLLAVDFYTGMLVLLCWILVAVITRYSSLAAIIAAILTPVIYIGVSLYLHIWNIWLFVAMLILALLLIWNHRGNIRNLKNGTETKIGHKSV